MNPSASPKSYALILLTGVAPSPARYILAEAARLAALHPEMLRYYCQLGLCGEARAQPAAELVFDDTSLDELRRFEHYRRRHGVDRQTLRLIGGLKREVGRLQAEICRLRGP